MFVYGGLIEPVDLSLPDLPSDLIGLRIAHLSDLHVIGRRRRHERLLADVARARPDLVLLTGDYMNAKGHEPEAIELLHRLCGCMQPRHGIYGVFGNHDSRALAIAAAELPVNWLQNTAVRLDSLPIEIVGLEFLDFGFASPDTVEALAACSGPGEATGIRLMLCHFATWLPTAADMGIDLMFSGHTHGGQCRLPGRRALINRCDLPLRLTSGLLRHKDTLCVVSRGLGEGRIPLRTFCRPHVPVLTLRRGPMPGQMTERIDNVRPW